MATSTDVTLHIDQIKGDPDNVRTQVRVSSLKELATSIKGSGLQQPIIVRPFEDGYRVIAGHRRLAAIGMLVEAGDHDGTLELDRHVLIREGYSEAEVTVAQLVENLQREDIDPLDEAAGYMRLLTFDMSQADISRQVGRSRGHVTKRLALLTIPDKAKTALRKQDITIEHALAIASLDDEDRIEYVEGGTWNEYQLTRLLRSAKGKKVKAQFEAALGQWEIEIRPDDGTPVHELPAPEEGKHWQTVEAIWFDQWDGTTVPPGATMVIVKANGEQASAHFYELVDDDVDGRKASAEEKRQAKEKAAKREERAAERAKSDFLVTQLAKVKATDAADIALSMALDRVGYANAKDICTLLDLEVPVKETTTHDGKPRQEKQYYPLLQSMINQARTDGDIGFLRRVVLACSAGYGYRDRLLELFGYDPDAAAEDG